MQTTQEQVDELSTTIRQLALMVSAAEVQRHAALRHQRWLLLALGAVVAAFLYVGAGLGPWASAQTVPQHDVSAPQQDAAARSATREALIAQLSPEQRRKLEQFEREVGWLSQYMRTWDEGQAGAVIALMLFRMADNMDSVPKMHREMEVMSSLMSSMPVVATEMQRMNASMTAIIANMGVMSSNMDSTMGRMGRMMPWMPW